MINIQGTEGMQTYLLPLFLNLLKLLLENINQRLRGKKIQRK